MNYLIVKENNQAFVFNESGIKKYITENNERVRLYRILFNASPMELRIFDGYVEDFFGNLVFAY